eukprot:280098-Pleurochrysis_carterae.AAC.1
MADPATIGAIGGALSAVITAIGAYILKSRWRKCVCCGLWECEREVPSRESKVVEVATKA